MLYKLRVDASADQHGAELEKSMLERAIEEQAQREREGLDKAHAMLAKTQAEKANSATVLEAKARRSLRELKQGVKMEEVREAISIAVIIIVSHLLTFFPLVGAEISVEQHPREKHPSVVGGIGEGG